MKKFTGAFKQAITILVAFTAGMIETFNVPFAVWTLVALVATLLLWRAFDYQTKLQRRIDRKKMKASKKMDLSPEKEWSERENQKRIFQYSENGYPLKKGA